MTMTKTPAQFEVGRGFRLRGWCVLGQKDNNGTSNPMGISDPPTHWCAVVFCWHKGVKGKEQSAYSLRKLFLSKKLGFITFIKARRGRTTAGLERGVIQIPSLISAGAGVRAARSGSAVRHNRVEKFSLLPPRLPSRVCHRGSRVPVAVAHQSERMGTGHGG